MATLVVYLNCHTASFDAATISVNSTDPPQPSSAVTVASTIAYLTIELKGSVPEDLRPQMGHHVFGCDICQDVCPWNRKRTFTTEEALQPQPVQVHPSLAELAQLTPQAFKAWFRHTPLERSKRRGVLRNVCVAMGNSGNTAFIPLLETLADDEEALIREHAAWALTRLRQTPR